MEQLPSTNVRKGTSTQARVGQGQQQSIIALLLNQSTPVENQNRGNLQQSRFNNSLTNAPNISPVAPNLNPSLQQCPQPPTQDISARISSQQCKVPGCSKCNNVAIITLTPVQHMETNTEQMPSYQNELDELRNLIAEKDVKISDLTKLTNRQAAELSIMRAELGSDKDILSYYRGEIIRLNDLVYYYQKNEGLHSCDARFEAPLKDLLKFVKTVILDFKRNTKKLTGKYCDGSDSEMEQDQNIDNNESEPLSEQVEQVKDKFKETASVLVELTDMGCQEFVKQLEQLQSAMTIQKAMLVRKVTDSLENEDGSESGESSSPPHSSQSADGELSNVPWAEEVEQVDEFGNGEISEVSMRLEPPPPGLHSYSEEINKTSGKRAGPYHDKIKRRRRTKGNTEKSYNCEGVDHDDHVRFQRGRKTNENGIKRRINKVQCSERNGKIQSRNAAMAKVAMKQPGTIQSSMVSSEGQNGEDFIKYGALSKIFCEQCGTPFPNLESKIVHLQQPELCEKNKEGDEIVEVSNEENINAHYAPDELREI